MKKNEKKEELEAQTAEAQVDIEAEVDPKDEEINKLNEIIKGLEADKAETNDKYLRVLAEYDNFRKRTQKEREALYQDAYIDAVSALLPIVDNVEMALKFTVDENDKKGIEMIVSAVHQTLEKMGVSEVETKTFDPSLHNAVMHVDDESLGEGEIVEVFQKGYACGDRVIRYAMVKVAN
ncbi:MAG: nucleotide exchange factor GrpE [Clostridia bacterium]|nr:nucleotide exchange factor GrpE [Clostridia bacterium]